MSEPDESLKGYPRYKLIQWSATLAMLLLLLAGSLIWWYPSPMGQLCFCAFGIATGLPCLLLQRSRILSLFDFDTRCGWNGIWNFIRNDDWIVNPTSLDVIAHCPWVHAGDDDAGIGSLLLRQRNLVKIISRCLAGPPWRSGRRRHCCDRHHSS